MGFGHLEESEMQGCRMRTVGGALKGKHSWHVILRACCLIDYSRPQIYALRPGAQWL